MPELSSLFVAGPGGIMTDEVGVITGDLELKTVAEAGVLRALVRYEGAEEWYAITGGTCPLDPVDHPSVHSLLLGVLNRPTG